MVLSRVLPTRKSVYVELFEYKNDSHSIRYEVAVNRGIDDVADSRAVSRVDRWIIRRQCFIRNSVFSFRSQISLASARYVQKGEAMPPSLSFLFTLYHLVCNAITKSALEFYHVMKWLFSLFPPFAVIAKWITRDVSRDIPIRHENITTVPLWRSSCPRCDENLNKEPPQGEFSCIGNESASP